MSELADARGLNYYVFGMERTHLSMWSDSDLRYVKSQAEFADVHMMK